MALLPPDSTPRRRRDRAAEDDAAARQRARLARDLGDEQGQAWAHEPRRRRSKLTLGAAVALIAFAGLGAVPVFLGGSGDLLPASCDRPALEVGAERIPAGRAFAWQAAGPERGPYVLTLDAAAVSGPPGGPITPDRGRVLAGPTTLPGCRTAQTRAEGPTATGVHEVALFQFANGRWQRAAVALLTVS